MQKNLVLTFILTILLFGFSCTKETVTSNNQQIETTVNGGGPLYANSFENPVDTLGLAGHCFVSLIEETPDGGGSKALSVSCGCIAPHASFEIGPYDEDHDLVLSCMARGFDMGGSVSLQNGHNRIYIPVSSENPEWQYLESADTLFCPANEVLTVEISAGGIASGMVDVDLLEVKRVE